MSEIAHAELFAVIDWMRYCFVCKNHWHGLLYKYVNIYILDILAIMFKAQNIFSIWEFSFENINAIQKVQQFFFKCVLSTNQSTNNCAVFRELGKLTINIDWLVNYHVM